MIHLVAAGELVPASADGTLSRGDSARILAARRLIDARWHERLTLEGIAGEIGINREKLRRGFRSMFACTVADAIVERRLGAARCMLLDTDLPVSSIGYRSGYLNNASFSRAFARHFGVSPSDCRARRLRDHIRAAGLRVGDTLPGEAHFAAELGVSRAVTREAFGAIGALRHIDVGNGRKARVGALDGSAMASALSHGVATAQISIGDVWDVRRTIELRTVILAAERRTPAQAGEIVARAEAMVAAGGDVAERIRHDIAFHEAIARESGNALFVQIVGSFGALTEVAVPAAWNALQTEDERQVTIARHRARDRGAGR